MMRQTLCASLLNLSMAATLCAATYHVAPDGSDANDGLSWSFPMATISNAVAQSDAGLVLVSNGTYNITATIAIYKEVTVRGVNTPGETNTIIDGGGSVRCFILGHAGAMLDGLLITNGDSLAGAGVQILSTGGNITNCLISGNVCEGTGSSHGGGGIWMYGTGAVYNSRIIGNRIIGGTASYPRGGGVFLYPGTVGGLLENCLIAGNICTNSTTYGGGGIYIGTVGRVRNCVISNNQAALGGGITMSGGGVVTNCQIVDNISLNNGGGIHMRDAGSPGALVTDCVISNNRTGGNGSGGGIHSSGYATQTVRNCIITHNWSTNRDGGGIAVNAGVGGALIDGCTIEFNRSSGLGNQGGGGIHVTRSGAPPDDTRILNCIIRQNQSALSGGGAVLYRGGVISNCVIEGNLASTNSNMLGGGVYVAEGGVIADSRIISNTCWYFGGGIYAASGGTLINCLVAGNVASNSGGGLFAATMSISNGSVQSCTFAENETVIGGGGGIYAQNTNYFINTIVWSNRAAAETDRDVGIYPYNPAAATNSFHYCCASRDLSTANQHNITNAPGFVDAPGWNFRLASGSPCINTGSNAAWMAQGLDLDERPRLDRLTGQVDMGAYEYLFAGTMWMIH